MISRLILGDGAIGSSLVEHAVGHPGTLFVVTDDAGWVTTLRDSTIPAVESDPTDPTQFPSYADFVVVADSSVERTERIVTVARETFPEATISVVIGVEATAEQRKRLTERADHAIDPTRDVIDRVLDTVGGSQPGQMHRLLAEIRPLSKPLAVVAHDNPDPDAIASALALAKIAESVGVPADACYFGEISHQENRALVNLLSLSMRRLDPSAFDPDDYGAIALVDHARPGVNDSLPPETPVSIVIDHHPPRVPLESGGRYLDVRPEVGSTSTIMVEYLRRLGLTPDETLSTALLYGIQTDTKRFTREVSQADFEAASFLSAFASEETLRRIESPSVTPAVLDTLATAIDEREIRERALASCVGRIGDRDALAQAADELLNMEGVSTVIVFGYLDGTIYVSGRARGPDVDLGETLRDALGQIGSAGGHANMAGAQLPLGLLESTEDDASLSAVVRELVAERFFAALDSTGE